MSKRRIELLSKQLKKTVYAYYRSCGRHTLPWRATADPYKILVSEMMLQQTQVSRVVEKYNHFLTLFPTVEDLARASLQAVLIAWSGLGYNRRAKYLHQTAQQIVLQYKGVFPKTREVLQKLPGIGPYTAGAVSVFAYNQKAVLIETNIRTVFIHHFFSQTKQTISDTKIIPLIELTIDTKNPRTWYWALMDYGAYLKQQGSVVHRKSIHYKKQKPFKGSTRQLRGAILRTLIRKPTTLRGIVKETGVSKNEATTVLSMLTKEGMIIQEKAFYRLATQ